MCWLPVCTCECGNKPYNMNSFLHAIHLHTHTLHWWLASNVVYRVCTSIARFRIRFMHLLVWCTTNLYRLIGNFELNGFVAIRSALFCSMCVFVCLFAWRLPSTSICTWKVAAKLLPSTRSFHLSHIHIRIEHGARDSHFLTQTLCYMRANLTDTQGTHTYIDTLWRIWVVYASN